MSLRLTGRNGDRLLDSDRWWRQLVGATRYEDSEQEPGGGDRDHRERDRNDSSQHDRIVSRPSSISFEGEPRPPAQLGNVTQLSSLRPYLCPRTPGTFPRCAPRGWGRGRSTIPGTRGTRLPRGRAASSTRYTSSGCQLSSFAPLIKNERVAAVGSGVGWLSAITAPMSSVARKRPSTWRRAPLMVH